MLAIWRPLRSSISRPCWFCDCSIPRTREKRGHTIPFLLVCWADTLCLAEQSRAGKETGQELFCPLLRHGFSVNQQIVIYVFARVVLALARLSIESPSMTRTTPTPTLWTQRLDPETKAMVQRNAWPVFASLSWAFVMYIFRWQPESIQSSLRSSMKYMYGPGTRAPKIN